MNRGIFIQADDKQLLGAKVAKYAIETRGRARENNIPVTIMHVEDMPDYMVHVGMKYKRGNETRTHDPKDLQFFTLSRFMPPELMGYTGRALVIDPDIFALGDVTELFNLDLGDAHLAACRERSWFDSSVMLLENTKLKHWNIRRILEGLKNGTENYRAWMRLHNEPVLEIGRDWNSLDHLDKSTKMLHTTNRLTQPWKTGLPIDFTFGSVPKLFGIIPRFWVQQPRTYQQHPDSAIEQIFLELLRGAIKDGAVTYDELDAAVAASEMRPDIRTVLTTRG
ncbi:MAG: hypothetical protein RLZZ283_470 [Candidatus Parcubacteria bacterium]|jgi:hypothetical protein